MDLTKEQKKLNLSSIRVYVIYFFMYAIFGWLYEVFLEVVVYKWGFNNRGFLFGPYTPIYAVGALVFIFTIYPIIKEKKLLKRLLWIIPVFLGCMFAATLLELVTSYLMEWTTGSWPWQTYSDYDINFQARIALSPSIRFGLGGVFFLYVVQPIFEKIVSSMKNKHITNIAIGIVLLLFVDLLYTLFLR